MTDDDRWAGLSEAAIEAVMIDRFWRAYRNEPFTPDVAALRAAIEARLMPQWRPIEATSSAFLPIDPPAEHTDDSRCWCQPTLEYVGPAGQEVWAHRDGNGAAPPPVVIAQAIVEALMDDEEA